MDALPLRVVDNVACTGCGCVCDDLRLTVQGECIVKAEGACAIAEPWLLGLNGSHPPVAEVDGQPVALETAIARAAQLLRQAHNPLIYGLARSTTEGQAAAVALAETLGANIDTAASLCHAPSVMAQQQVGKVTCTLGEVANRADLVIFWGSDPLVSHPRHWERYSVFPKRRYVPHGRENRFVVVADTQRTATAEAADLFLPVEPNRHFEVLHGLRALVSGAIPKPAAGLGAPAPLLAQLVQRIRSSRCGAIFFGVSLAEGKSGHCNVQALLQLVTDLNGPARWYAMRMRVHGNVVGADSVLAWQTGYPFAVNMARGYPRYNPGEFSVHEMLERADVDACLVVGSHTLNWLSAKALTHLRQIPLVILDPPGTESPVPATVRFRTGIPGVHYAGTAYRMDGVPVPLRAVLPSLLPTDHEVLNCIRTLSLGADIQLTRRAI